MKIGVQLYTLREHLGSIHDIECTFKKLSELGYEFLEASCFDFKDTKLVSEILAISQKYNLKFISCHLMLEDLFENFEVIIASCQMLNINFIGIGYLEDYYRINPTIKKIDEYIEKINILARKLDKLKLKLFYHNHDFEFINIENTNMYKLLITKTQILYFELDIYWASIANIDIDYYSKMLDSRLLFLHLKDLKIVNGDNRFAAVGDGKLDIKTIILRYKTRVEFGIVEQDLAYEKDIFDELKLSMSNIKTYL